MSRGWRELLVALLLVYLDVRPDLGGKRSPEEGLERVPVRLPAKRHVIVRAVFTWRLACARVWWSRTRRSMPAVFRIVGGTTSSRSESRQATK